MEEILFYLDNFLVCSRLREGWKSLILQSLLQPSILKTPFLHNVLFFFLLVLSVSVCFMGQSDVTQSTAHGFPLADLVL